METANISLDLLGIDVAKMTFNVLLRRGEKKKHKQFANSEKGFAELNSWLHKQIGADGAQRTRS